MPKQWVLFIKMGKEIWRPIRGFESIYEVSDLGRLKSLKKNKNGVILKTTNKNGDYLSVVLEYKGKRKSSRIHRLVWESFAGDIPEKYHIHHIDHNKQNNNLANLLCLSTKEHNEIESHKDKQFKKGHKYYPRKDIYLSKGFVIAQYTQDGVLLGKFENALIAHHQTGVCARNILQVANKTPFNKSGAVRKQAGGYIWKFAH